MRIDSYVSEKRKKREQRRKYFFGALIFLALYFVFLGIFLFIVRLPAFQAERITIEGNSTVSNADIMNLLHASILRKNESLDAPNSGSKALFGFNNMLIWPNALTANTLAVIPRLSGVTIAKDYFLHTITVTATERQPFGVWCLVPPPNSPVASEQCYWFDPQGTIFGKAYDTQGNAILVIHDHAQTKLALNGKILSDEFVANFISIANVLKQSSLNIQEVTLNDLSLQEIDATVANGPVLHFSLRFPADNDLAVIKSLVAKSGFDKLQYIDFTVQNRAYYK